MKLLLIDFETTGIDPLTCRPVEVCEAYWDPEETAGKPVFFQNYLWESSYPAEMPKEAFETHGISMAKAHRDGRLPRDVLENIARRAMQADFFVGHNSRQYDKVVLESEARRQEVSMPSLPWIDTLHDLPFPKKVTSKRLGHLALDHGIAVDPKDLHGAVGDVRLMYEILLKYDLADVAKRATSTRVKLLARVSFENKDRAKAQGYQWDPTGKKWAKEVCDFLLPEEMLRANEAGFTVEVMNA